MRVVTALLFAALLILGLWSFVDSTSFLLGPEPASYGWWWPSEISTYGQKVDNLFHLIAVMVGFFFILTEGLLVWFVFRYSRKDPTKAVFSHGNHKLEMLWTAVPAGLLVVIAFAQMGTFREIRFESATRDEPVFAEVYANQFDWRYRYPGEDGRFGTLDDVETAFELVVPAGRKLVLHLRSRDVLHSFFVPRLRLKQDAVPGMTIPVWFEVDAEQFAAEAGDEGALDLDVICAELCGWGHYKMAGRVRVLAPAAYEEWMQEQRERRFDNGELEEL